MTVEQVISEYSAEPAAFWAMYSKEYVIQAVKNGYIVISEECTNDLNRIL